MVKYCKNKRIFSCIIENKHMSNKNVSFTEKDIRELIDFFSYEKELKCEIKDKITSFMNTVSNNKPSSLKRKITFNDLFLIDLIESSNNGYTIKEISELYRKKFPEQKFHNNTLKNYLKTVLRFRFISPNTVNLKEIDETSDKMNIIFGKELKRIIDDNHMICYLDESSFKEQGMRKRMWIRRSHKSSVIYPPRYESLSVIGAFSSEGLIHYRIKTGSYNKLDVIEFFRDLENVFTANIQHMKLLRKKKITIILDNSRTHFNKLSRKVLKNMSLNFFFQPPYSPSNNVSEYAWGIVKNKKRRMVFFKK